MKNRIWVLFCLIFLVGALSLVGCTTNRRPSTPTPGQTRTVPGPTRVTPPTTPAPGVPRAVPEPTRVTPRMTPGNPGTTAPTPGTTATPETPRTTIPGAPGTTNSGARMPGTMPGTTPRITPGTTSTPRTVRRSTSTNSAGDRAKAIARDLAKEKNIQSASCVITGDTALVGLQFDKQYKGKVTDAIKKTVDKRVKDMEPSVKKVVVTADPDLLSRIKTVAGDIEKGQPLSGFTKEVEEIIRRINPF